VGLILSTTSTTATIVFLLGLFGWLALLSLINFTHIAFHFLDPFVEVRQIECSVAISVHFVGVCL
jgi:hypothetical protein